MAAPIQVSKQHTCPVCEGKGQETHDYVFEEKRRNELPQEYLKRSQQCSLCAGAGKIDQTALEAWQYLQSLPVCPVCKGAGGKYFWSWDEGETGTRKQFYYTRCALCDGAQHVTPEQLTAHERERRRIRFWGVGCGTVAIIGGLFAVTQVVSLLVYQTPWVQCCAPPHIVFVSSILLMTRGIRWLI